MWRRGAAVSGYKCPYNLNIRKDGLTVDGLVISLGEELHGLGGAQRRAQQPLAVRVLPELPQDAGVGGFERRQVGLVLGVFPGLLALVERGGLADVDDEVVHAAAEVVGDVVAVAVHVGVDVRWLQGERSGGAGVTVPLLCAPF